LTERLLQHLANFVERSSADKEMVCIVGIAQCRINSVVIHPTPPHALQLSRLRASHDKLSTQVKELVFSFVSL
jgi:hypothetical protein